MKLSKLMMGVVCLVGAQLSALNAGEGWKDCNSPCHYEKAPRCFEMDNCDVEYHFYADFLYWDVQKSDLALGEDGEGNQHYLNPDYDFGYRLGACAAWHKWDAGVKYTWLGNHSEGDIPDLVNDFDATFKLNLNVVDIELGHSFCLNCGPIIFRPFVGAKLAWVKDHFNTLAGGGPNASDTHIKFNGYGIYLGACGRWELCNFQMCDYCLPISLVMRGSTGILRSEFKQSVEANIPDVGATTFTYQRQDVYTPVHEGYVGIDVAVRGLCDNEISLQLGYEAQYWGWRKYNDITQTTHLGMGGLVLRGGVSF